MESFQYDQGYFALLNLDGRFQIIDEQGNAKVTLESIKAFEMCNKFTVALDGLNKLHIYSNEHLCVLNLKDKKSITCSIHSNYKYMVVSSYSLNDK